MIDDCPPEMKRLITMTFAVDFDGDGFHVRNSTKCGDVPWSKVFQGMREIEKDITRQINERLNCPFHPKHVKRIGVPPLGK